MSKQIVTHVPNGEVKALCRLNRLSGATECVAAADGPDTSTVTITFPDVETFADQRVRANS